MLGIPVPGLLLCHLVALHLVLLLLGQATSLVAHHVVVAAEVAGQGHARRNVVVVVTIQFVGTARRWRVRGIWSGWNYINRWYGGVKNS